MKLRNMLTAFKYPSISAILFSSLSGSEEKWQKIVYSSCTRYDARKLKDCIKNINSTLGAFESDPIYFAICILLARALTI